MRAATGYCREQVWDSLNKTDRQPGAQALRPHAFRTGADAVRGWQKANNSDQTTRWRGKMREPRNWEKMGSFNFVLLEQRMTRKGYQAQHSANMPS
jgi:hypothetical protein